MPQKDVCFQLIEDTKVLCKNGKLIIPASLRHRAVSWIHYYLQHPGHSCLEKTIRSVMYWKCMRTTIRRYVKTCRSCQVNKRHSQKYGHLPPKLVITNPWKTLCVHLIGPYTLKGQDGSSIDFMCLTMISPVTSWFEKVELPNVDLVATVPPSGKGKKVTSLKNTAVAETTFDKSSEQISNLVYKTWFSRYPGCWYLIYNNGSKFKLHFQSLCNTYGIKHKPTSVKNPQANAILERIHAVLGNMLRTSELYLAETVKASDIDVFLSDTACAASCKTTWYLWGIKYCPDISCLEMYPTNILFGAPDKGQMLDVWGGIQQMSTLRWRWCSYMEKLPPQPGIKSWTDKDISGGISATILDHTDQNYMIYPIQYQSCT